MTTHSWRWGLELLTVSPLLHSHSAAADRSRPLINIFIRFRSLYPWPINMLHHYVLPPGADGTYARRPTLRLYTYSALDLFAVSDAVLGTHGTVIWTDSHSDDPRMVGGQRIAGKILRPVPGEPADLPESEEALNDGRLAELVPSADRYDSGTTMVFGVLRSAEVCKLAVDEEVGRIALGFTDGRVEVWEYFPEV